MNRYPQEKDIPEWMTKGKAMLIQKYLQKGSAPNNYGPIKCLPMIWKILTAQIREEMYDWIISGGLFLEEQKECCQQTRDTRVLVYIDQHIINVRKTRRENPAATWIDYKIAYDMVMQSWIIDCLRMYKISGEIIKFIENTIYNRRVELTARGKSLTEVKIQREISLGDVLSPLLFVILFTNPFARAGYDTTSIFKRSLTGLNSEFSFSLTSCLTMAEEPTLSYYLPIAGGRIGFIPFPRVLVLCENAIILVQELKSCHRVHFQRR